MKRVLTALLLFPIVIYVVLWSPPWAFAAVVAVVACLSYYEFDGLAKAYGFGAPGPIGYAAGLLLLFVEQAPWPWLTIVLTALIAIALAMRAADLAQSLPRVSLLAMGLVYIFGAWKCAFLLREKGAHWLMYALIVNWAGDIGAYYVGRAFGRHKLALRVSPKKTWEGAAGSVAASVLVAGAYLLRFAAPIGWPEVLALTIMVNIAGQVGDLAESAMKRGAGVKDSGTILPGHGGFLDRVDSTLFALPVVYAWLALFR
jgi:phosphatidate cytidylyltransferase